MTGRYVDDYEERDYYREPPRAPVQVAERPAPMRSRDLEDLWRRPADDRDRQVAFLQDDYARTDEQPLVLRGRKVETYQRPIRRSPSRGRSQSIEHERVRTRVVEKERERSPSPVERTRVRYVQQERQRSPSPVERTRVRVAERQRELSPEPEIYRRERYVERERERSPSPLYDREQIRTMTRTVERRERSPSPERERTSVRVVQRERERQRSRSSSAASSIRMPPEPHIIRAPPIHQEIITHHRHIDHGYEPVVVTPPAPRVRTPLPPPSRPRQDVRETDIDIHTGRGETDVAIHRSRRSQGARDERPREFYDDDVVYERERERDRLKARTSIQSSVSVSREARESRDRGIRHSESEADYYARKTEERAYIGEAYNGATKKWEIVDVPPGTERVKMDGVGGGSQEVTWQKYNGVRRSKFIPERDSMGSYDRERERGRGRGRGREWESDRLEINIDQRRAPRPPPPPRNRFGDMWTEVTKDLVVREAIEELGYDYEETEYFFYIFQYLKYDDVVELVDISTDIANGRRNRIREIAWEREHPRHREREREREREILTIEASRGRVEHPYDDERIIEREIVYDTPRRSTRIYY